MLVSLIENNTISLCLTVHIQVYFYAKNGNCGSHEVIHVLQSDLLSLGLVQLPAEEEQLSHSGTTVST